MRVVLQRVKSASVCIDGEVSGAINDGLLVFLGISKEDDESDIKWLSEKLSGIRVFVDDEDKINKSVKDIGGNILLISQFTLFASTRKGKRPSFLEAASPDIAIPLYEKMIKALSNCMGQEIQTGEFGANMQVESINDGPITITIDSRNRE